MEETQPADALPEVAEQYRSPPPSPHHEGEEEVRKDDDGAGVASLAADEQAEVVSEGHPPTTPRDEEDEAERGEASREGRHDDMMMDQTKAVTAGEKGKEKHASEVECAIMPVLADDQEDKEEDERKKTKEEDGRHRHLHQEERTLRESVDGRTPEATRREGGGPAPSTRGELSAPLPPSPGGPDEERAIRAASAASPRTAAKLACPVCSAPTPRDELAQHARACLDVALARLLEPRDGKSGPRASSSSSAVVVRPTKGGPRRSIMMQPDPVTEALMKRYSGWWDDLAKTMHGLASDLGLDAQDGQAEFLRKFNLSAISGETLRGVFGCRLVDGEAMVAGEAFVGKLHFAFAAYNGKYKVVIPYRSIVAIDRVSAVLGEDAGAVPSFVKPSPAAGLVADALRFRTTDRKERVFWTYSLVSAMKHQSKRSETIGKYAVWADLTCSTWRGSVRSSTRLSSPLSSRTAHMALELGLASVITALTASAAAQEE